jgi:hypothetical protein
MDPFASRQVKERDAVQAIKQRKSQQEQTISQRNANSTKSSLPILSNTANKARRGIAEHDG